MYTLSIVAKQGIIYSLVISCMRVGLRPRACVPFLVQVSRLALVLHVQPIVMTTRDWCLADMMSCNRILVDSLRTIRRNLQGQSIVNMPDSIFL
jgi:hypothetical protein